MFTQTMVDALRSEGAQAKRIGLPRDCAPAGELNRVLWLEGYDREPDPEPLAKRFDGFGPLGGQGGDV